MKTLGTIVLTVDAVIFLVAFVKIYFPFGKFMAEHIIYLKRNNLASSYAGPGPGIYFFYCMIGLLVNAVLTVVGIFLIIFGGGF